MTHPQGTTPANQAQAEDVTRLSPNPVNDSSEPIPAANAMVDACADAIAAIDFPDDILPLGIEGRKLIARAVLAANPAQGVTRLLERLSDALGGMSWYDDDCRLTDVQMTNRLLGRVKSARAAESAAEVAAVGAGGQAVTFQQRVQPWMMTCFGPEISADKLERNDRFIEEALELVQASDYPKERALALVDYVYGRDQGDINQEVGGVMVTLAAHCLAHGVDMHEAGEAELARIWTKVDAIRAKQAAKPTGSALPVAHPASSGQAVAVLEWVETKTLGGGRKLIALDCFHNEFHRIDLPKDAEAVFRDKEMAQKRYDRCILSAIAHPVQPKWRDMSSAPKDGAKILYRNKFGGIGYCHWDEGYNEDEIACWWDSEEDNEVCPVAWLPTDTLPAAPQPKGE